MAYAINSWFLATGSWHDSAKLFNPSPLKVKIALDFLVSELASSQPLIASSNHYKNAISHTNRHSA